MQWIELDPGRSGEVAPEFSLRSGAGTRVTRSQHRQRCNLVLFFLPAGSPAAIAPTIDRLAAYRARFDEAGACVYAITAQKPPGNLSPLLLIDPDGAVRASFAKVFPEGDEPGAGEPFAVVLDRYSKPWYAGRGDPDDTAFDEALTKLWAIEYDCPE